jgi:LmbE family N-acetylglucosaminyl deacetylase
MLQLNLKEDPSEPFTLLCLGAHSDDIEIGAGGTVLELIDRYPNLSVVWVVLSGDDLRAKEAQNSADKFLASLGGRKEVILKEFRGGFFPWIGDQLKEFYEELKRSSAPDLILTHFRRDAHQDHRMVCDLTWNTWRDHMIWEYEIPKWDGDLGRPGLYVPISKKNAVRKLQIIMDSFDTQSGRHWFTEDLFYSMMRIRGMEVHAADNYAEAFYAPKVSCQ